MAEMVWRSYHGEKCVSLERFFSLFENSYSSDFFFRGETHDFWEMMYVREGDICVSADERIYHLSKGEIIFHKPMEFHKFHIENGKPATLFIMSFVANGSFVQRFENCVLQLSMEQQQSIRQLISFLYKECALSGKCDDISLREMEKEPAKFQRFLCMTELLLLSLLKDSDVIRTVLDTTEAVVYRKAIQVMEKRVAEWISVPEIAEECDVSVSYLKKLFAKYAGLGIHQYFLKTKIINASRMLKEGKSVSETATALSFSSPNYFSTVYKRETGVTPLVYKHQNKRSEEC